MSASKMSNGQVLPGTGVRWVDDWESCRAEESNFAGGAGKVAAQIFVTVTAHPPPSATSSTHSGTHGDFQSRASTMAQCEKTSACRKKSHDACRRSTCRLQTTVLFASFPGNWGKRREN